MAAGYLIAQGSTYAITDSFSNGYWAIPNFVSERQDLAPYDMLLDGVVLVINASSGAVTGHTVTRAYETVQHPDDATQIDVTLRYVVSAD